MLTMIGAAVYPRYSPLKMFSYITVDIGPPGITSYSPRIN